MQVLEILAAAAFVEAHRPQARQDREFGAFKRTGYSLGWNVGAYRDDLFLQGMGGFNGFHSHIGFMPDRGVGIAILVNSGFGALAANAIAEYAYDLLDGRSDALARSDELLGSAAEQAAQFRQAIAADRERRAPRSQVLSRPLAAYAGRYERPVVGRMEWTVGAVSIRGG